MDDLPLNIQKDEALARVLQELRASFGKEIQDLEASKSDLEAQGLGVLGEETEEELARGIQRVSIEDAIQRLQLKEANAAQMVQSLYTEHGLIAKPVSGDGSCGVHTAIAFCEKSLFTNVQGEDAEAHDTLSLVSAYRSELKSLWEKVSDDAVWQMVLQRFIDGRVDLKFWMEQTEPVSTPVQKKRKNKTAFTPDKEGAGSLLGCGEKKVDSVVVCAQNLECAEGQVEEDQESEPPKKTKRTGKPLPWDQKVTFPTKFSKFLSEKGITYREYIREHTRSLHIVRGGSVCPTGKWDDLYKLLEPRLHMAA